MTAKQVIERERECVARQQCDRNCAQCDLVMEADDILHAYDHALDFLEVEEKTGMTPEDAATIGRFREHIFSEWSYARMAEIAQAERDGRLVVLPCRVGDTVWRVWRGEIYRHQIVSVWYNEHIKRRFFAECIPFIRFDEEAIGKSIFLKREEAVVLAEKEASE